MQTQDKKIIVALSGGVDSAVAAAMLIEQGWRVRGVHLLPNGKAGGYNLPKFIVQVFGNRVFAVGFSSGIHCSHYQLFFCPVPCR